MEEYEKTSGMHGMYQALHTQHATIMYKCANQTKCVCVCAHGRISASVHIDGVIDAGVDTWLNSDMYGL